MKRSSVWTVTEFGESPVSRVAEHALRKRLDAVWAELVAASGPQHHPERVYRLRVATRRTLAAFSAFRAVLPAKRRSWFEKRLRRVRKAASDTRDLDVLTSRLAREQGFAERSEGRSPAAARARERLVTMLTKRRDVSRRPIQEVHDELRAADWGGRVEQLLEQVASSGWTQSFVSYGHRRFRRLLRDFFDRTGGKLTDAATIHRLRIEGKRLRYALEIFAVVFPKQELTACHQSLERLQRFLGDFTDHASAADWFHRWSREKGVGSERSTLAELRRVEDRRADDAQRAFVKWWKPSRRRALRRRFERALEKRKPA
ncbi:MAG: CHAD domain-containing protein [Planctomycetes bacterium]|nr:CHAD domain-containing protein [Planctomycetota bacterium]